MNNRRLVTEINIIQICASFYPNGILSYDVYPEHLERNPFRATVGYTKDTRVEAKHAASKELKEYLMK